VIRIRNSGILATFFGEEIYEEFPKTKSQKESQKKRKAEEGLVADDVLIGYIE